MLTKVSGRTSRMASAQYFLSSGFAIPAPYATLQAVGNLHILSAILVLGIILFIAELNYLDPALSPVYPFVLLVTLFAVFFLFFMLGWVLILRFMKKRLTNISAGQEEHDVQPTVIKASLRMLLTSLVLAFAPVVLLAIRSLHSVQFFDFIAIGLFEILALIYIYKKYPHS